MSKFFRGQKKFMLLFCVLLFPMTTLFAEDVKIKDIRVLSSPNGAKVTIVELSEANSYFVEVNTSGTSLDGQAFLANRLEHDGGRRFTYLAKIGKEKKTLLISERGSQGQELFLQDPDDIRNKFLLSFSRALTESVDKKVIQQKISGVTK